jgi:hypothetical protein
MVADGRRGVHPRPVAAALDPTTEGAARMTWQRKFTLVFGGLLFVLSALPIARYLGQPADIWWTPRALALPLSEAADRVEVYVGDEALQRLLESGRVQLLTGGGPVRVTESEVRLRLNNRDRIRAERIPSLLGACVMLGASGVLLLLGLLGRGLAAPRPPGG